MTAHLIHIGYPKTGSNALRRWFAEHPEIAFADGGIAGFRNVHELVRHSAAPVAGIACRVTSSEVLATPHAHAGDPGAAFDRAGFDPLRESQARVCAMLRELFPNAHLLIVTRGFRAMLRSGYSQFVRSGGDPAEFDLAGAVQHPWDYDYVIGLYREAFPGRVIVLPYELLRDDAGAFVAEIERALGLGHVPPAGERLNPSLTVEELRWYPRLTRLVRALPVGGRLRRRLFGRYVRAARANRFRPLIRILHRLAPAPPALPDLTADAVIERFRGRAECLRGHPLYAPYSEDYLL